MSIWGSEGRSVVGVNGKLVAIEMVDFPPEAPWPNNTFSIFSLGWRQGVREKERLWDSYPELKQGEKTSDTDSIQGNITSLQSSFSSTRTQSPSITESFPRAHTQPQNPLPQPVTTSVHPVGGQASTHVPLRPWKLMQRNGVCLAVNTEMMPGGVGLGFWMLRWIWDY